MSTILGSTGITFPDNTTQTTTPVLMGASQSYTAPSRAIGTTYTNNTSKPIWVSVIGFTHAGAGTSTLSLYVNGTLVQYFSHAPDASGILHLTVSSIVPPGNTYRATAVNLDLVSWRELG